MSFTVRGPGTSLAGLRASEDAYARGLSRISSGFRITRAADDAAGLAISQRMRSQVNGSAMALRNVQDGINMLQTAEGGLSGMTSMLQRARELAVQAASTGTMTADDRAAAAAEVRQLVSEIDRTARSTSFNGQRMLDGSRTGGFTFQVGAKAGDVLGVEAHDLTADALLLSGSTSTTTLSTTTYTATSDNKNVFDLTGGNNSFTVSVGGGATQTFTVAEGRYDDAADHTALRDALQAGFGAVGAPVTVTHRTNGAGKGEFTFTATADVSITGSGATAMGLPGTWTASSTGAGTATLSTVALADLVASGSADAISLCDDALTSIIGVRTQLGATQNRMEHRLSTLATTGDNLDAARSRIEDADIAKEYAGLVRAQVLTQAGMAMQAQGAQSNQRVLQLLGSL